ncbi:MAG: valine--tRNA ligase [Gemmatimonadota bacterium]
MSLPDRFDSASEPQLYERWVEADCFKADAARSTRTGGDRDPFTIVIPPPNVTAILHLGHALDNVTQDVLIRWARMRGQETLWMPGTDHAGIATQNVVEKIIAGEGKTRFDVGRDAFVKRTEAFVEETGGTILKQLRAIGASADWSRTAYTFSPELSRAVREAFARLYEKGLIYRGHRVIHWCPRCHTSLSDEEAEFQEEDGALYHIRYRLSALGSQTRAESLVVATTRPETMLGDVAVAVNPKDPRYAALVGTTVVLPILDLEIPIIADDYADPAFGTGVVKITPAHDANDFEVGKRHALPMPVVIDADGNMNAGATTEYTRVPDFVRGKSAVAARDLIKRRLKEIGALEKTESKRHSVRHCYRCDTVVEPRLSDQWFVKMAPLAKPALDGLRAGAMRILPQRWEAVYINWLEGIRDWNISRQLWWGHRIPVWYCKDCDPPYDVHVSRTDLTKCPHCAGPVRQDEDVLDTWFSSWLWPLSTLGWPDDTRDMKAFYPTDVLVSGPDIIFFWVARMVMAGYFFTGRSPYHTVLLHGIARDGQGRKMSKSLGNGVDPMEVVRLFGADAMRWTLVSGMGLGADITLDPDDLKKTFATGRNFVTKLWNIARFLLEKAGTAPVKRVADIPAAKLQRVDEWILWRLDVAIAECDAALGPLHPVTPLSTTDQKQWKPDERLSGMRLNDLAETARRFVWNELADWYLEAIKGRLAAGGEDAEVARAVLVHAFDGALRLLHPIVPFVTEAVWQQLPSHSAGTFLATAPWPAANPTSRTKRADEFELIREVVSALRQIRAEYAVPPGSNIDAIAVGGDGVFREEAGMVERLSRSSLKVASAAPTGAAAHAVLAGGVSLVVPLAGLVDIDKECARLTGELASVEKQLQGLEGRLSNEKFTSKAPPDVVAGERAKLAEWTTRRQQLRDKVQTLCGG